VSVPFRLEVASFPSSSAHRFTLMDCCSLSQSSTPSLRSSCRPAKPLARRRGDCTNRLRQFGGALPNNYAAFQAAPQVRLLPYFEQQSLRQLYDAALPWNLQSPQVAQTPLASFAGR
jgi:hypothetical protein